MDRDRRKNAPRVVAALSGGVDSSVAAALLKRAGFKVKGAFMRLVDSSAFKSSEKRARRVAEVLDIPFAVVDLRKEFKRKIIDCLIAGYKKGLTPNPCVFCNKLIKFNLLFERAKTSKGDFFATGHYVRLKGGRLFQGKDKEKDQSYFLWQLSQKELKRTLFPVGHYTKKEVKVLAKEFKFPLFEVSESQEICFVQTTINDFLKRHLKLKPGMIIDSEGKVLGQHQGLAFYTTGQRKGIKLAGGPYYVLDKDFKKNLLIVTKNEKDLYKRELIAKNVNWIGGIGPKLPLKIKARIRYRHPPAPATITNTLNPKAYTLKFNKPQRAITPGQSVVFYQGQELVGGGIIC